MDVSILMFFTVLSVVLYIISRLTHTPWVALGLGWIAGGLLIIIGFTIWDGENITKTFVTDAGVEVVSTLSLGISNENFLLITGLIGLVMIYSSSGDWI